MSRDNEQEIDLVKCPFCKHQFNANEDDKEVIGEITLYYCRECGEEFHKNLRIK